MHNLYLFLSRDLRREAAPRKCHQNIMTPTGKTRGWIGNVMQRKRRTFQQRPVLSQFTIWLICIKWRWILPSFCPNRGLADRAPGWATAGKQPAAFSNSNCSDSCNQMSSKLRIHLPRNKHLSLYSTHLFPVILFMQSDAAISVGLADVCRAR